MSEIGEQQTCAYPGCGNKARRRGLCDKHRGEVSDAVAADRSKASAGHELTKLKIKYEQALKLLDLRERELAALSVLQTDIEPLRIEPREGSGTSEAVPVLVASDWHVEELVGPEVGGLNISNPEIIEQRATKFFQAGLRLIRLLNQDITINRMLLPLLGDFITNDIHGSENAEKNAMPPTEAIQFAQNLLIGGIEFLLDHSPYEIDLHCHSGNHGRTTATTRFATENGHSLEYLMYLHLAAYFRHESRVRFHIAQGMHSYAEVYDTRIRFHHGHAIKYQGGVGGIYIPVNKAIAQWNKARNVDLDVFGHFHQLRDGGNFICNGSLIGYNAYALSIKADFEKPKQALFLIDKKRGRTCTWPVLVE